MSLPLSRAACALAVLLAGCASLAPRQPDLADGSRADVAMLETTDVHSNILSFDYYKNAHDPSLGYARTATLIARARKEFPNTFLFDDGDTIQGTVLADYQATVKPVACDKELAMYAVMDHVGYDGGSIGNHEFNYGLAFLSQVTGTPMDVDGVKHQRCDGPHFPLVLANVDSVRTSKPIYQPWTVVTKTIEAYTPDGSKLEVPLKIGIIGFAPPPIMQWDQRHLQGKVTASGVVEAAKKYLPQLQAKHPDLIVALLHGGLDTAPYTPAMENPGWYLAGVPGIDVLLMGHQHSEFPGPHFADMSEVDAARGFVRGTPAVMGGYFGKDLGVIKLALDRRGGRWVIDKNKSHSEVRPICASKGHCVPADPAIAPMLAQLQQATVAYVNSPIGTSDLRLSSVFADEGNMSALAPVNAAQIDYVARELPRTHPELADMPILGAAAAFRTGFGGPEDYTNLAPGPLTLRSAADLYLYPNTLAAVKTDGAGLKAWLEHSAQRFNRIDPAKTTAQPLINNAYQGFNFDQIQGAGLHYQIDVTRPVGQRITALTWHGKPITPAQPFIIVTNNYRASGGGNFPGLDGKDIVLAAPDGTREILARWVEQHSPITTGKLPENSWHFAPAKTRGPVTFTGPSGKQAMGVARIRLLKDHGDGAATYAVDLAHETR